ncbi:unnamed protein product [Prorocentrum cordatum]|nr:unnamed protein product [Polarella glacialis]
MVEHGQPPHEMAEELGSLLGDEVGPFLGWLDMEKARLVGRASSQGPPRLRAKLTTNDVTASLDRTNAATAGTDMNGASAAHEPDDPQSLVVVTQRLVLQPNAGQAGTARLTELRDFCSTPAPVLADVEAEADSVEGCAADVGASAVQARRPPRDSPWLAAPPGPQRPRSPSMAQLGSGGIELKGVHVALNPLGLVPVALNPSGLMLGTHSALNLPGFVPALSPSGLVLHVFGALNLPGLVLGTHSSLNPPGLVPVALKPAGLVLHVSGALNPPGLVLGTNSALHPLGLMPVALNPSGLVLHVFGALNPPGSCSERIRR